MKSKRLEKLLRALVTVVGVGFGSVLAFAGVQLNNMTGRLPLSIQTLLLLYATLSLITGVIAYLLAPRVIDGIGRMLLALEKSLDAMSFDQLMGSISGLVGGLVIAALLSQLVMLMGSSMFTVSLCAILFVVFGVLGVTLGIRRAADLHRMFAHLSPKKKHRITTHRRKSAAPTAKLLDDTVLLDGRIAAVCRAGFLEGTLLISPRVEQELQRLATSDDENNRIRGEKGQATLLALQTCTVTKRIEDIPNGHTLQETLLADARQHRAVLLTCDAALFRAAQSASLPVRNLNDLACALRPTVQTGDVLTVKITKAGREPGQGIGYQADGTMIVVEGAQSRMGQTIRATVSSVLQTNAGRMIFANAEKEA